MQEEYEKKRARTAIPHFDKVVPYQLGYFPLSLDIAAIELLFLTLPQRGYVFLLLVPFALIFPLHHINVLYTTLFPFTLVNKNIDKLRHFISREGGNLA